MNKKKIASALAATLILLSFFSSAKKDQPAETTSAIPLEVVAGVA